MLYKIAYTGCNISYLVNKICIQVNKISYLIY